MGMESKHLRMEISMKETILITSLMELANIIGKMVQCMKDSSLMVLEKVMENGYQTFIVKIVTNMRGNTMKTKKMDLEFTNGPMVQNMKDCLRMI